MNSNLNAENVIIRLKQILNEKSDQKLGDYLGIPKSTISNWRQRDSVPYSICVQVAQEKNVSLDWLLTGEGAMLKGSGANDEIMSPKRKRMMELLERLDDDALDDAIYSTKKLVENCEMKAMLQQLVAGKNGQRMAQAA
ncbi:MAG: helix-turn-helix transcriptional regulator [Methylococcaceae bacterium]